MYYHAEDMGLGTIFIDHVFHGFAIHGQGAVPRLSPGLIPETERAVQGSRLHPHEAIADHKLTAPVDFLIKWNRRGHDPDAFIQSRVNDPSVLWESPRAGKRITVWETGAALGSVRVRRILRLTERTTLANGQRLLLPDYTLEGWDTTLPESVDPDTVITLYADHATHEQFHAEIKTDLDLERLPSGKFATNDLILTLGAMAYNILRMIGQETLLGPDAPRRHPAKRRRVKTVIQEIITLVARIKHHARQWILSFLESATAFTSFQRLHSVWSAP